MLSKKSRVFTSEQKFRCTKILFVRYYRFLKSPSRNKQIVSAGEVDQVIEITTTKRVVDNAANTNRRAPFSAQSQTSTVVCANGSVRKPSELS